MTLFYPIMMILFFSRCFSSFFSVSSDVHLVYVWIQIYRHHSTKKNEVKNGKMYYEPNTHKTKTISSGRIPSNNWWIDQNSYLSFDSFVGIFISVWIVSKYYVFSRPNIKKRKMMMILYSQNILHCFFSKKRRWICQIFLLIIIYWSSSSSWLLFFIILIIVMSLFVPNSDFIIESCSYFDIFQNPNYLVLNANAKNKMIHHFDFDFVLELVSYFHKSQSIIISNFCFNHFFQLNFITQYSLFFASKKRWRKKIKKSSIGIFS